MPTELVSNAPLTSDLEFVASALDESIIEILGADALPVAQRLRDQAIAVREKPSPAGRGAMSASVAKLSDEQLELTARVFTLWFHLANACEEQHRVRVLRAWREAGHTPHHSVASACADLVAAKLSADEVRALLGRMFIMPVLTAHPTEARRRTVLDHLETIDKTLDARDHAQGRFELASLRNGLLEVVEALLATDESRTTKPTPRDEIESGLDVFVATLLDVTPALYRVVEDALAAAYPGEEFIVPSFLRWGTWIGGDRDGNPFVTAHVTRRALERHRATIVQRYVTDLEAIGRLLSVSSRRVVSREPLVPLEESLVRDRARMPEIAARYARYRDVEPWREKLWFMRARLLATLERGDGAYVDVAGLSRDLELIRATLAACGHERLTRGLLRDVIRRVDAFGFHLASLDVRQHSGVHERVVGELLETAGQGGYAGLDEPARCALLTRLLESPADLSPTSRAGLSREAQDVLATLDMVGRARRENGVRACERYIVSFTSTLSDLLEVLYLQRAARLAPGELRPVPLLEQLEDLANAAELANQMLDNGPVSAAIGRELEVMIGYSDAGKQIGYFAAATALREAQLALASVAETRKVVLTIFHGRGGAIGRGGGPANRSVRAQPERAVRGRLRVTEQGETITARYGRTDIALRDLEQLVSAIFSSAVAERTVMPAAELQRRGAAFAKAADAARAVYQGLLSDPDKLARYAVAATPIQHVAALPLGSRPASRRKGLSFDDLRAIPWVFSWNQSRHVLPGWFGLGTAIDALVIDLGLDATRALYHDSPFFRALVDNARLALVRADIDIAALYAALAEDDARELFDRVREEHKKTVAAIASITQVEGDDHRTDHILSSVARRNPYVDVLSHLQVELLKRQRASDDPAVAQRYATALFTTISGIAAGLQTAG